MTEGRKTQIILPDERRLDIIIQPKLFNWELLDLVASHFKLKEKPYFGLNYIDDSGHYTWLNLDKRVLDHDFPKRSGLLILNFSIRFYIETIGLLRDSSTVELFYLNARQAIFKGLIETDAETVFELAAHVLQATHNDYVSDEDTRSELKKLPVIPTSSLQEHPSIVFCEDRIISYYQKLQGTSRGLAIVNYMNIVEHLPTYGIHYYEVKDKKDIPWWLGISPKGICVFDKNDKTTPRKTFTWKQLENLYYRDKKFSIEVHDPKRVVHTLSSFNLYEDAIREQQNEFDDLSNAISDPSTQVSVSRRTFGPGNVNVHAWFAASHQLTKCIWSMAVAQHQFYLDRKQSKGTLASARSMSEIAADLSRSTTSLPGSTGSDISRSASSQSLPSLTTSRFDLNIEQSDSVKAQREMYQALKARKEALEEALKRKTEELKRICFQEGELTGELPLDTPLAPGEQIPTFRRRVGTAFSLSSKIVSNTENAEDQLSKIELEYELQGKITSAAHKLAMDKTTTKNIRKQRKQSYNRALQKLKDVEKKLNEMKRVAGKIGLRAASSTYDDSEVVSPAQSPSIPRYSQEEIPRYSQEEIQRSQVNVVERPPVSTQSFRHHRPHDGGDTTLQAHNLPHSATLSPSHSSPQLSGGYLPSRVYATRTQYRSQMYPTISSRSRSSSSNQSEYDNMRTSGRLEGSQDSGFSSGNNMYNINSQRKSHYDSSDHLKGTVNAQPTDAGVYEDRLNLPSKHGSLDGAYRKGGQQRYNSLERKPGNNRSNEAHMSELIPSRFGSKRESQSEYDPPSNRSSLMVEVPVQHEAQRTYYSDKPYRHEVVRHDSTSHLVSSNHEADRKDNSPQLDQCYSPRGFEGSFNRVERYVYPTDDSANSRTGEVQAHSPAQSQPLPQSSSLVTVTRLQPHMEVSKPYEMADFYKYSERLRRQRLIDHYQRQLIGSERLSRASTPSQHSTTDSETSHHSAPSGHFPSSSSLGHPSSPYRSSAPVSPTYPSPAPIAHSQIMYGQSRSGGGDGYGREASSTYQTVKTHGPGVQYTQSVSYHSSQQVQSATAPQHKIYQPLQRMTCEPVKKFPSATSGSPR